MNILHINQQNNIRRIYIIYICVLVVQIHFFKEEQEAHVVKAGKHTNNNFFTE